MATIIGKGPSAYEVDDDLVIGLNHAGMRPCVHLCCAADEIMLRDYTAVEVNKTTIIGRQRAYRYPYPTIRVSHGFGSSCALAIHYLAELGYTSVNLVGFDAYEEYLAGKAYTSNHAIYKHVNKAIDMAIEYTSMAIFLK